MTSKDKAESQLVTWGSPTRCHPARFSTVDLMPWYDYIGWPPIFHTVLFIILKQFKLHFFFIHGSGKDTRSKIWMPGPYKKLRIVPEGFNSMTPHPLLQKFNC